jgi:hypothetical protein
MAPAAVTENEASGATATNMAVTERPGSTPISSASLDLADRLKAAGPDERRHGLVIRVGGRGPDDDPPRFEVFGDGVSLGVRTVHDPIAACGSGHAVWRAHRLSVSTLVDDLPDDASSEAVLAPGEARAGLVGWPDDEDSFRVTVGAGVVHRFDAQPDGSAEDPLDERTPPVFDVAGTLVGSSDRDAIHRRAMADGALSVSVSGFYDHVGGCVASVADIEDAVAEGAERTPSPAPARPWRARSTIRATRTGCASTCPRACSGPTWPLPTAAATLSTTRAFAFTTRSAP